MNNLFSEIQIKEVQAEFNMCITYKDKLRVYDKHFGILTDIFPEFDPKLEMFYQQEGLSHLAELFEKERRHSVQLEKVFMLKTAIISFNITPMNTYPEVFNDFIIEKFIEKDLAYNQILDKASNYFGGEILKAIQLESEANKIIKAIELKLHSNAETSLRNKFMTVFYQGYTDHCQNNFKKFSKRKKIIELFLYSHGILYGRYIDVLRNCMKIGDQSKSGKDDLETRKDLSERINLLHETGVLDFLKQKYNGTEMSNDDHLINRIICRLLGVGLDQIHLLKRFN